MGINDNDKNNDRYDIRVCTRPCLQVPDGPQGKEVMAEMGINVLPTIQYYRQVWVVGCKGNAPVLAWACVQLITPSPGYTSASPLRFCSSSLFHIAAPSFLQPPQLLLCTAPAPSYLCSSPSLPPSSTAHRPSFRALLHSLPALLSLSTADPPPPISATHYPSFHCALLVAPPLPQHRASAHRPSSHQHRSLSLLQFCTAHCSSSPSAPHIVPLFLCRAACCGSRLGRWAWSRSLAKVIRAKA